MDERAAKLAAARQKLKHHQEKKMVRTDFSNQNNKLVPMETMEDIVCSKPVNNETIVKSLDSNITKNCIETNENDVMVTEILIANKTKLEAQVKELETQIKQLQCNYTLSMEQQNFYVQTVSRLEMELQTIKNNYITVCEENILQKKIISELQNKTTVVTDENNNLMEQLEFTKTVLTVKENENSQLSNHISVLQNQLDVFQLQINQLTNNSNVNIPLVQEDKSQSIELIQKNSNLEQQLRALQKERDNISSHYEHYVSELNSQLKASETKNNELNQEIHKLYNRENSLIDQISEMEIRLQGYHTKKLVEEIDNSHELQEAIKTNEKRIQELRAAYDELQAKYHESQRQIQILQKHKEIESSQDNISITKLTADITSDKVAAQRATEQNKKLKTDLVELEFAFVKMSKDKLELTEKLTHEKQLNKELMLKLAEVEENMKFTHDKLMAKDEEMIRLQNSYRSLEKDYEISLKTYHKVNEMDQIHIRENQTNLNENEALNVHNKEYEERKELIESNNEETRLGFGKEDAMLKLQERFLNIMDDVANLSDEKHRLEHIILQLQNETDTICEYIALYQQQRSLLKKRDEDRSEQIKMFQIESDKLRKQLEELNDLLLKFANDKQLITFLEDESRKNDLAKVMKLLLNLKNSSFISSNHKSLDFKSFYPCNCCSGQLIDV